MITREDVKKVIDQLSKQQFITGINLIVTDDYYIFKKKVKKEDKENVVEFPKEAYNL